MIHEHLRVVPLVQAKGSPMASGEERFVFKKMDDFLSGYQDSPDQDSSG